MTARRKLEEKIRSAFTTQYLKDALDEFERGYAHELAEKIRNSDELRDLTDDHMSDCYAAADLIDPELEY